MSTSASTLTGLSPGTLYHARIVIAQRQRHDAGRRRHVHDARHARARRAPGAGKTGAKKFCKVPKVTGKKLNKARKKVVAAGCKVKVVYKKSKRPKGIVLKQSRKAGKKLELPRGRQADGGQASGQAPRQEALREHLRRGPPR